MAYAKTTFGDVISRLRKMTGNQSFYDDYELRSYINEGIRVWNLWTGYWRGSETLSSISGEFFYDTTLMKVLRVEVDSVPLEKDSIFNLDFGMANWQSVAPGTPIRWFPIGLNKIGLVPAPIAGMSLTLHGILAAPVCTLRDDTIDAAEDVIGAILNYAQHIASFKSGGADFDASMSLLYKFVERAGIQNEKFRHTSIYRNSLGQDNEGMMHPQWKKTNDRSRRSK